MKNNVITITLVVLVVMGLTGFGVHSYYKVQMKALKALYETQINANAATIVQYHTENIRLKEELAKDSIAIAKKSAELVKLRQQASTLQNKLVEAKETLKNFTAGEAITFFVNYAKIDSSKMLIQNSDTSMVIDIPSVQKVNNIFLEHKFQIAGLETLSQMLYKQDGIIAAHNNSINLYKELVSNKDAELSIQKSGFALEKSQLELTAKQYKMQRNQARWIIGGTAGIAIATLIVKLIP